MKTRAALVMVAWLWAGHVLAVPLHVAVGQGEQATLVHYDASGRVQRTALPPDLMTPLGSLWKLFIHDFLRSRDATVPPTVPREPDYTCTGNNADDIYCCLPGQSIDRDRALLNSCGPYFAPARIALTDAEWSRYWTARFGTLPAIPLDRLQPETRIPVHTLLAMLAAMHARDATPPILIDRLFQPLDPQVSVAPIAAVLGSRLRVKTWSWRTPEGASIGGAAGWLVDGTPVWFMASGTSRTVLREHAATLDNWIPAATRGTDACVDVNLFSRYPITRLTADENASPVVPGALRGRYHLQFAQGQTIDIVSDGDIFLHPGAAPRLTARIAREEYVARVIDREASPEPREAARALAVVVRTYLLQQARRGPRCLQMEDSTRHQRMAPRPASTAARAIALWTADTVLAGGPVNYHAEHDAPGTLGWRQARQAALEGLRYDAILARNFPASDLAGWDNPALHCTPLPAAEAWLHGQLPRWREVLSGEPGFQPVSRVTLCRLMGGVAHVDRTHRRLYVKPLSTQQDRLDLAHEYLHLAFEHHPAGMDEAYIEHWARRLILE